MKTKKVVVKKILNAGIIIVLIGVMLCGLHLSLQPSLDVWLKKAERSQDIDQYHNYHASIINETAPNAPTQASDAENVESTYPQQQEKWPELLEIFQQYNLSIFESGQQKLCDAFSYADAVFDMTAYGYENSVFAILTVPALDIELPIRLGASEANMSEGAAQMTQTSVPIGGNNTNAVLAIHRNYIMEIEDLREGDCIYIENPWEILEYTVVGYRLIDPYELDPILIQEGRDMITLLTCHPWGSGGRYRYLVYAERSLDSNSTAVTEQTEIDKKPLDVTNPQTSEDPVVSSEIEFHSSRHEILMFKILPIIAIGTVSLVFAVIIFSVFIRRSKRKQVRKDKISNESEH